jgi:hypothetical protein
MRKAIYVPYNVFRFDEIWTPHHDKKLDRGVSIRRDQFEGWGEDNLTGTRVVEERKVVLVVC